MKNVRHKSSLLILPFVLGIVSFQAQALEIDEKLTLRFLNVSASKKTVLINRGAEDGLVIGDHAKFFITAGVVARGVVEKVSPTRSVWSLYRVVDSNEILKDRVLNLKIATPVKITDDPSRSLKEEMIPGADAVVRTRGGNDLSLSDDERSELSDLGLSDSTGAGAAVTPTTLSPSRRTENTKSTIPVGSPSINLSRNTWEAFGTLYVNSLTGTFEDDSVTTDQSTSAATSTFAISAGIEKYFYDSDNFLKNFSIAGFVHKRSMENGDSVKTSADWFEFGVGVNYHFYNAPSMTNRLIGYGSFVVGKGTASVTTKTVIAGVSDEETADGDSSFFGLGVGAKYVVANGFGVRALVDYYSSTETYEYETSTSERTLSGPRVQFGISYRF